MDMYEETSQILCEYVASIRAYRFQVLISILMNW